MNIDLIIRYYSYWHVRKTLHDHYIDMQNTYKVHTLQTDCIFYISLIKHVTMLLPPHEGQNCLTMSVN
jgi:hypothetical protein